MEEEKEQEKEEENTTRISISGLPGHPIDPLTVFFCDPPHLQDISDTTSAGPADPPGLPLAASPSQILLLLSSPHRILLPKYQTPTAFSVFCALSRLHIFVYCLLAILSSWN